jgi:glycosyltransferase involved in cell wall biosynthesis
VSRAFTKLYQASGFKQTKAVPNGAPLMETAPRIPSPSGRVRLCHIGGMSKFKGFNLLRVALQHSAFAKLELTVVDESRYGGGEQTAYWGSTPVRIVGKTLPEDMPQFYARHDVLLAPSLWPEAFGLVSREALALGLWVVASDRGAIGEDVTVEVNGFVIDVATPEPLRRVLARIDAEPDRFTTSPPPQALRTARMQATDLVTIYQEILSRPRREKAAPLRTVAGHPAPAFSHDLRTRKRAQ